MPAHARSAALFLALLLTRAPAALAADSKDVDFQWNGRVAMWGGSYAGFDQWTTAKERPPHLVTIVPTAAVHPGVDFPSWKGIFYSYDMQWLTYTSGKAKNTMIFGEGSLWSQKYREL